MAGPWSNDARLTQSQHRALVSRPPIQFRGRTGGPCSSLIVPAIATSCRTLLRRKCGTGKTGRRFLFEAHSAPPALRARRMDQSGRPEVDNESWNNIIIPGSWPYHGHPDDKPHPWFTDDFDLPRMGCGIKRPQVTQHQGRSSGQLEVSTLSRPKLRPEIDFIATPEFV